MPIRKEELDPKFKKQLQNPLKPINDTRDITPEFEEHLNKINDGQLVSEETKKRLEREKKDKEEDDKYKKCCNSCRRPTLKKTHYGMWKCSFCGAESNSPILMSDK